MACDLEDNSEKHTVQISITDVTQNCCLGQKTYMDDYVPLPKPESINDQASPFHFAFRIVFLFCCTIFMSGNLVSLFFNWEVASRRLILSRINYPSEGELKDFGELLQKISSFHQMSTKMFSQGLCACIAHALNFVVCAYFAWRLYKQQNQELEIKEKNKYRMLAFIFSIMAVGSPIVAYMFSCYARGALKDVHMSHSMIKDIISRQPRN